MTQPEQMKRGTVVEGRGAQAVSGWLDVLEGSTNGARFYSRPRPGTMVACAMDRRRQSGVVLGAIYTDRAQAPADSDTTLHIEMADGSVAVYDAGVFTFTHAGGAVFRIEGTDVSITGNLNLSGNLTVDGSTSLQATTINGIVQTGS